MHAPHIHELIASRRVLLRGMAALPLLSLPAACATGVAATPPRAGLNFTSVAPTNADQVTVPEGYQARTVIAWGDALFDSVGAFDPVTLTRAEQEQRWGCNNDMLALFPATHSFPPRRDGDEVILCANNEFASYQLMFPDVMEPTGYSAEQIEAGLAATGVSIVRLRRIDGAWRPVKDAAPGAGLNRRITPFTPMVFSGPAANHAWITAAGAYVNAREAGRDYEANPSGAIRCGTNSNCAGGQTPWGTYLTSEENFNYLFAATDAEAAALQEAMRDEAFARDCRVFSTPGRRELIDRAPAQFDMSQNPYGPALYGWVCEIDPYDPSWAPRKRTALGRKKGECATTALTRDRRVAVYMGDDQRNEFTYKFVSRDRFNADDRIANRDLLDHGVLYVARLEADGSGRWIAITADAANAAAAAQGSPIRFADEADAHIRSREAARLLGATPMDRPEDVEAMCDANWVGLGPVLIACTNNSQRGAGNPGSPERANPTPGADQPNFAGHILRLDEADGDCGATRFAWDIFALGGDPDAEADAIAARNGAPAFVAVTLDGAASISGDRFACPDNICIDSAHNVWISTDGSDGVFPDCNDQVVVTPASVTGARPVKRFLVGPVGCEICGPTMALDERAFFVAIQHPGEADVAGVDFAETRWRGAPPPSHFPDGGDSWPRAAVVEVTRRDGGRIGD